MSKVLVVAKWIYLYLPAPIFLAHEFCHYATARALGVKSTLQLHRILYRSPVTKQQNVVIHLAPAIAGVLVYALLAAFSEGSNRYLLMGLVVWLCGCINDFKGIRLILAKN